MTRILFLALVLIAAAADSGAQTIKIRSGEHGDHTRLVAQIPPGTRWVLTPRRKGAQLSLDLDGVEFETASVFERLNQGRLASLAQSEPGAALEMEFGCECVATAFLHRDTMVVVDIAPGEHIPSPEPAEPVSLLHGVTTAKRSTTAEQIQSTEFSIPLLQLKRRGFETQLMSRILQGSDREIVDMNLAGVGARQSGYFGPLQLPLDLPANLNVTSILDELSGLRGPTIQQIDTRPVCISDTELGFHSWSDATPFTQQVADLRADLFHEFDRLDIPTVEKLAQLYTYHGFGAEAVQVLHLAGESAPVWNRVRAIAHLMDKQRQTELNPFRDQQRCGGDAALWAVLIDGQLTKDARSDEIELAFVRLPRHLKRQFGAGLSEIFVAADKLEASRRVLRAIERVEGGDQPQTTLAKAGVAKAEGDGKLAEELLVKAATNPNATQQAPLALARLVEKRWSDRGAVTGQEIELLEAYATEHRNSEIGPMLAQAYAVALGLNQEFDTALGQLRDTTDSKDWTRTQNQVLHLLVERADDVTFLRHTLSLSTETQNGIEMDTAIALSERLIKLGFAGRSFALANRRTDTDRSTERARLRAHAALQQKRPRQALLELSGDDSETALLLRAQALVDSQDFAGAALALAKIGSTEDANRNFWRAGLFERTSGDESGQYDAVAQLSQSLTGTVERQPDKPLTDAAKLLQTSAEMRAEITQLFEIIGSQEP
ncbi:hypothetical protein [Ruegeria sp.]|uniref:hypothetical protein n=1 Tax=Ruegeria sp. TaxID=1879320 RepID=UPI003C7B0BC8